MLAVPQPSEQRPQLATDLLGYDYALLGLAARECRSDVIRRAASSAASRIQDSAEDEGEQEFMLAHLAASTYRLLDPRKRSRSLERVHLSLLTDTDWERQRKSREPFQSPTGEESLVSMPCSQLVVAELVEVSSIGQI